jgi:tyrosine-protein kinase Etk/Wzc
MDGKLNPRPHPSAADEAPRNRVNMNTPESDDEIDLGQLIVSLWRGKVLIAICTFVGVAIGAFLFANTWPTFQADALLQLEERNGALALPTSLSNMVASDPRSDTEIEILKSRMVLGQAVADLDLDWRVSPELVPLIGTMIARYRLPFVNKLIPERYARPGDRLLLEQLVVPPNWLNLDLDLFLVDPQRFRLTLPDGQVLSGTVGQPIHIPELGFSLSVSVIEAPAGRRFVLRQLDEIRSIADLRARLSVSERGRASGILEVRLTGTDRMGNARALNAIIQAYLGQNVARSAAEAESSLTFIRQQIPQAERNLREAEAALNAFRQEQVTVDLALETQTMLGQITRIEGELAELRRQEDELAQRYTPAHPAYRQMLDERARLEARLAELRQQVGTLPETQRQILNLSSAVELAQGIYTELLTRAQEVEVMRASTIGNVRIIDSAAAAALAVAPRKLRILALGLVLGAMAGAMLVLVRGWMRRGVQDAAELEKLGLPVFATINYSKAADTRGKRQGKLPILALEQSADLAVEALRSLRTSLHFGMLDARTPTLTITSSHPGAGKSFLSVNLAVVAAQAGQRVCLIDADLRRGQLRRYFDVTRNQPGLSEVLAGDLRAEGAILGGPLATLSFLSTGRYPPNPSELLMRSELSGLIDWCAQNFDLTIFDTPPALAVTDPVIMGRNTGATIFVAQHDVTALAEVEAATKTFASAGVRISGVVLNSFDPKKARGAYGYGYGYRYEYKQRKQ